MIDNISFASAESAAWMDHWVSDSIFGVITISIVRLNSVAVVVAADVDSVLIAGSAIHVTRTRIVIAVTARSGSGARCRTADVLLVVVARTGVGVLGTGIRITEALE